MTDQPTPEKPTVIPTAAAPETPTPTPPVTPPLPPQFVQITQQVVQGNMDDMVEIGAFPGRIHILLKVNGGWVQVPCNDVPKLISRIETARDAAALLQSTKS